MRYFLITFSIHNVHSVGNLLLSNDKFPSYSMISQTISEERGRATDVVIENIFEFRTEQDYKDYKGE
jgi:hypothetical protein